MNVRVILQSVMRMQFVLILMAALSAPVLRDIQAVVTLETVLVCVPTAAVNELSLVYQF